MSVESVLFERTEDHAAVLEQQEPAYFGDLNLDQLVASLTATRKEYDLAPFFHTRLRSVEAIAYRHDVFREFEDDTLAAGVERFAAAMRTMRIRLAQASRLRHRYQQESWFLEAVET